MTFEDRPLTKEHQIELEGYVAHHVQLLRLLLFLVAIAAVGAIFRFVQALLFEGLPLWLLPTLLVGVLLYSRSGRWTGGPALREKIRQDLAGGQVRVLRVELVDVIEVEEQEDEGPSFIVETRSGETILLTGQYLAAAKARKFPWTCFELIEAPKSKLFLGLEKVGEPAAVNSRRPPFSYEVAQRLGCFERDYVILNEAQKALAFEL